MLSWLAIVPAASAQEQAAQKLDNAGAVSADFAAEQQEIERLIRKLGAPRYADRQRAEAKLVAIGPDAFDLLQAAELDRDPEIAARARYLSEQVAVEWILPNDPLPVREVMSEYAAGDEFDRSYTVLQLIELDSLPAFHAICRIVRYDRSETVSKLAAVYLLDVEDFAGVETPAGVVAQQLGRSRRPGAQWVRLHFRERAPAEKLPAWREIIEREQRLLAAGEKATSLEIVAELLVHLANTETAAGEAETAWNTFTKLLELDIDDENGSIHDCVTWVTDQDDLALVRKLLASRFRPRIEQHPIAAFRLAKEFVDLGQATEGEELVAALDATEILVRDRRIAASWLISNGLFDWGEHQLRRAIESEPGTSESVYSREQLASLLADQNRFAAAADVLRDMLAKAKEDKEFAEVIKEIESSGWGEKKPGYYRGLTSFYEGRAAQVAGDKATAIKLLAEAARRSPHDIDAAIAYYRATDAGSPDREKAVQVVQKAADRLESEIENSDGDEMYLNNWAWLISNTEGDYDLAVKRATAAVAAVDKGTERHSGFLDTLGRCHFAAGNLDQAIATQRQAIAQSPHNLPLQHQLKEFEAAKAAQPSADSAAQP